MAELSRPASWFKEWGMESVGLMVDESTDREFPVYCRGKDGALLIVEYAFGKDAVFVLAAVLEATKQEYGA